MVMYSFHPTHFILAYHHENVNHGDSEKEALIIIFCTYLQTRPRPVSYIIAISVGKYSDILEKL